MRCGRHDCALLHERERAHARARARWGACTYQCEVDCTLQPSVTADVNLSADVPSPPELSTIAPRGGLPRCLLHPEWRTHPLRCAGLCRTAPRTRACEGVRGRSLRARLGERDGSVAARKFLRIHSDLRSQVPPLWRFERLKFEPVLRLKRVSTGKIVYDGQWAVGSWRRVGLVRGPQAAYAGLTSASVELAVCPWQTISSKLSTDPLRPAVATRGPFCACPCCPRFC